jgi:CheY-like chemotaxis protein
MPVMRCLVVDDEPDLAEAWAWFISREWPRSVVRSAADPLRALSWVREGDHVDVLVTDVNMPGMTGIELAEQVRAACPDVRILLVTGDIGRWLDQACKVPGAVVLGKPFPANQLVAAVASLAPLVRS